ncbi:MAG: glycosyltransferase family 2 protein [Acidobacteriota bacterium]
MNIYHSTTLLPKVTILIPVFNEQDNLPACLNCVISQSYSPGCLEIIVIDGGSTDKTFAIAREYGNRYSFVRVVQLPGLNVPQRLNAGATDAEGEILVRVDARSRPSTDYVIKLVSLLLKTEVFHVGVKLKAISDTRIGRVIALALSHPFGVGNSQHRTSDNSSGAEGGYLGGVRKKDFFSVGGYDPDCDYTEDDEFSLRLIQYGKKVLYTPDIEVPYICRGSLISLGLQFFRYGKHKQKVLRKHGRMPSIRPYIPLAFVSAIVVLLPLSLIDSYFFFALFSLMFVYIGSSITLSIISAIKKRELVFLALPIIFATLHLSYGIGELFGIVKFVGIMRVRQIFAKGHG